MDRFAFPLTPRHTQSTGKAPKPTTQTGKFAGKRSHWQPAEIVAVTAFLEEGKTPEAIHAKLYGGKNAGKGRTKAGVASVIGRIKKGLYDGNTSHFLTSHFNILKNWTDEGVLKKRGKSSKEEVDDDEEDEEDLMEDDTPPFDFSTIPLPSSQSLPLPVISDRSAPPSTPKSSSDNTELILWNNTARLSYRFSVPVWSYQVAEHFYLGFLNPHVATQPTIEIAGAVVIININYLYDQNLVRACANASKLHIDHLRPLMPTTWSSRKSIQFPQELSHEFKRIAPAGSNFVLFQFKSLRTTVAQQPMSIWGWATSFSGK